MDLFTTLSSIVLDASNPEAEAAPASSTPIDAADPKDGYNGFFCIVT
jgi:hypothetical protein